jgi:hypothetical protein
VFFVCVSEPKCQEGDHSDDGHATAEGEAHEEKCENFSIVTLNFEFFREQYSLHFGLHGFSLSSTVTDFLVDAVEDGHGDSGVDYENYGVEEDLITDGDVPIREEVRVFGHAGGIADEIVAGDEVGDKFLEGNRQNIGLDLYSVRVTRRVMSTVVERLTMKRLNTMALDCSAWVLYLLNCERKITICFSTNLMMTTPMAMAIVMAVLSIDW